MKISFRIKHLSIHVFLLIASFILLSSLFIMSCNSNKGKKKNNPDCITITHDQLKTWLKEGWNNADSANFIPLLNFVPSVDGSFIKIKAYPLSKDSAVERNKEIDFTIKGDTSVCSFPKGLVANPQFYDFSKEGFADSSGNLIPFEYLRLIPRAYSGDSTFLSFDVHIVTKSGDPAEVFSKGETLPCPPNCPPPPPHEN